LERGVVPELKFLQESASGFAATRRPARPQLVVSDRPVVRTSLSVTSAGLLLAESFVFSIWLSPETIPDEYLARNASTERSIASKLDISSSIAFRAFSIDSRLRERSAFAVRMSCSVRVHIQRSPLFDTARS